MFTSRPVEMKMLSVGAALKSGHIMIQVLKVGGFLLSLWAFFVNRYAYGIRSHIIFPEDSDRTLPGEME